MAQPINPEAQQQINALVEQLGQTMANVMATSNNQLVQNMAAQQGGGGNDPHAQARRDLENQERREANIIKAAATAPRYRAGDKIRDFRAAYVRWRAASGICNQINGVCVYDSTFQARQLLARFDGHSAEQLNQIAEGTDAWNNTILNARFN